MTCILLLLLEGFSHVSSFQVIILSAKLGLCSSSIHPIHCCPNGKQPVRGIFHVPSRAIALLSQCLRIKAAICFCISDKHFIFPPPLIHLSLHPLFCAMCVSVICLVGPVWYMCHPNLAIPLCHTRLYDSGGLGESTKSYPQSFVFTCTLRQIHVRHKYIVHSHQYQGLNYLAIKDM